MFGNRHVVSAILENVTPLHIGTGEDFDMPRADGGNETSKVAAIVRDHTGKPYLPATATKGVLRRIAEEILNDEARVAVLFGPKLAESDDAADKEHGKRAAMMGRVLFRGAAMSKAPPSVAQMPYASEQGIRAFADPTDATSETRRGDAFVAAHTAVNGSTGVAEDNKLFFQEMLADGAQFRVELVLLEDSRADVASTALADLRKVLEAAIHSGLYLGKGGTDGNGELRFVGGRAEISQWKLKRTGELHKAQTETIRGAGHAQRSAVSSKPFEFRCAAPFMVTDSSFHAGHERASRQNAIKGDRPQSRSQRRDSDTALLLGSSVSGVLRARALWLAKCRALREPQAVSPAELVDRLFGTEDWKGLVNIRNLRLQGGKPSLITSLRTDRFAGGGVDGALFTTEAFAGVTLSFTLELTRRGAAEPAVEKALKCLFAELCSDLQANGIQLGHGGSKGFGWFDHQKLEAGNGS